MTKNQRDFFDVFESQLFSERPPHSGSDTSQEAAEKITSTVRGLRLRVLEFIESRREYGATRPEIEAELQMSGNTVRPRVSELLDSGRIRRTDRKRLTASNRKAEVLVATVFE